MTASFIISVTGDPVADMRRQVELNKLDIERLEKNNMDLIKTIHRVQEQRFIKKFLQFYLLKQTNVNKLHKADNKSLSKFLLECNQNIVRSLFILSTRSQDINTINYK